MDNNKFITHEEAEDVLRVLSNQEIYDKAKGSDIVKMTKSQLRLPANKHIIDWIRLYLFDEYPNLRLERYMIEAVLMGLVDFIKTAYLEEKTVTVSGLGKFFTTKRVLKNGNFRLLPKFKLSRHLLLDIHAQKGQLTKSEEKELKEKKEFLQKMWSRKQERLNKHLQHMKDKNISASGYIGRQQKAINSILTPVDSD